ncbi:MAG: cysteine synthase family protein [Myxococcota bacterium]
MGYSPSQTSGQASAGAHGSVLELIGGTPLIRVRGSVPDLPDQVEVHIKAEWMNPGGSVKDRAARAIVLDAIERGQLSPGSAKGRALLDSSSGNTGIAYAMLGAAMGFEVVLCIPENANRERKRTLQAYGATLIFTDPNEGSDGAILKAQELAGSEPERYYYADQYSNDANWKAHYESTGPEIVAQTGGRITHFISGLGTSGTCMGVGRYLRDNTPNARVIAFEPDSPFHGLEGMKHMETAIVPAIYDRTVAHENRACQTERGYDGARLLAQRDGIFLGISAGAAAWTALQVAKEEAAARRPAVIVAIGCDGGSRYLSEHFWEEILEDSP